MGILRASRRWLAIDRAPSTELLVAGSGRSGTTWLAELLGLRGSTRIVFEPFHPEQVPETAALHRWPYLKPGDDSPRADAALRSALGGGLRGAWVDQLNGRHILHHRRLVKSVRCGPFLPWLLSRAPELQAIWIVRHPCAVAASRVRMGWRASLGPLLRQPAFVRDVVGPHERALRELARQDDPGSFEHAVAFWALDNLVPLHAAPHERLRIVFYEQLVTAPRAVADGSLAGIDMPGWASLERGHARPSALTRSWSDVASADRVDPRRVAFGWRERVGDAERAVAGEWLTRFGLEQLWDADGEPQPGALTRLAD